MRYILILVFALISFSSSAQSDIISSDFCMEAKIIDGATNDWVAPMQYNDNKISYSVSNDNENLYLVIQTISQSVQQKIMRSGMTVSFSSKSPKKKNVHVYFPLKADAVSNTERLRPDPEGNNSITDQRAYMRDHILEQFTEMKVKGIKSIKGKIPVLNDYGVLAAINWEGEKLLTYEIQLPIKELFITDPLKDQDPVELELKILVSPLPQPDNAGAGNMSSGSGGGRRGGGRSMSGGGAPPSGMRGGDRSAMFTADVFTSKIALSKSK